MQFFKCASQINFGILLLCLGATCTISINSVTMQLHIKLNSISISFCKFTVWYFKCVSMHIMDGHIIQHEAWADWPIFQGHWGNCFGPQGHVILDLDQQNFCSVGYGDISWICCIFPICIHLFARIWFVFLSRLVLAGPVKYKRDQFALLI